jgi:hypothetical protein
MKYLIIFFAILFSSCTAMHHSKPGKDGSPGQDGGNATSSANGKNGEAGKNGTNKSTTIGIKK